MNRIFDLKITFVTWKEIARTWPRLPWPCSHSQSLTHFHSWAFPSPAFSFFSLQNILTMLPWLTNSSFHVTTKLTQIKISFSSQPSTSSECSSPLIWGLWWEWSGPWTPTSERMQRWTTGSSGATALACLISPSIGALRRASLCWGRSVWGHVILRVWKWTHIFNSFSLFKIRHYSDLMLTHVALMWFVIKKKKESDVFLPLSFACQAAVTPSLSISISRRMADTIQRYQHWTTNKCNTAKDNALCRKYAHIVPKKYMRPLWVKHLKYILHMVIALLMQQLCLIHL